MDFCNIICWTQSLTFCLKISCAVAPPSENTATIVYSHCTNRFEHHGGLTVRSRSREQPAVQSWTCGLERYRATARLLASWLEGHSGVDPREWRGRSSPIKYTRARVSFRPLKIRSTASGFLKRHVDFDVVFFVVAVKLFEITDRLGTCLQAKAMTAGRGVHLVNGSHTGSMAWKGFQWTVCGGNLPALHRPVWPETSPGSTAMPSEPSEPTTSAPVEFHDFV